MIGGETTFNIFFPFCSPAMDLELGPSLEDAILSLENSDVQWIWNEGLKLHVYLLIKKRHGLTTSSCWSDGDGEIIVEG